MSPAEKISKMFMKLNTYNKQDVLGALIDAYNMGYSDSKSAYLQIISTEMEIMKKELKKELEIK